jgi:DNA-binding response OmpR family regulator
VERTLLYMAGVTQRILVVDDEPPILFALRDYFQAAGYQVDCAGELEEAQALIAEEPSYDLVIADLRLDSFSGTSGLELIGNVRDRSTASRILLLTAYGSPEIEAEALRRGADAFLHKPIPLPKLAVIAAGLMERAS